MDREFLDTIALAAEKVSGPLTIPWPKRGQPAAFRTFETFEAWHDFVLELQLPDALPQIVTAKYQRALDKNRRDDCLDDT